MGLSSSTSKTKSTETGTTTPNIPSYATPAIKDYYAQVGELGQQIKDDPSQFVAPANSTITGAVGAANNLGGWQTGLNASTAAATSAGNTNFAPVNTTLAQSAQLGPAGQTTAAGLFDVPLENYLNPATEALVDTTLAGFDDNSGRVRAAQAASAAKGGAFGGSRYGIAQAQTEADLGRERASTEAGLRSSAFDRATALASGDAGRRQEANLFNTGAKNDFSLTQGGFNQSTNLANADATNTNARFNSGLDQQEVANRLTAAQIGGSNSANAGQLAQGDVAARLAAGQTLQQIEQAQAQAPITSLAAYNGLIDPAMLAAISGQTVNTSGTSTSKQSGGLLGQLIGGGFQLGAAAISDPRLKRDIEMVDVLPDGLGVYQFNYLWDDPDMPAREGVMADEVEVLRPWAMGPMLGEFRTVDYSKLEGM